MHHSPAQIFTPDWNSAGAIAPGLREIAAHLPHRFAQGGLPVTFHEEPALGGLRIVSGPYAIVIHYTQACHASRALGILLSGDELPASLQETTPLTDLGVMLDVSRNAVLRPEAIEPLFRHLALMGINSVQLYMEDVYALEGEPYFGYARGVYSPEELRRIDDYGALLGLEVIPCIQTLGHMQQILKWPAYDALRDVPGVLLVGDEKVYALIRKMLETMASCFRSKRIHIGMDEAHGVGQGRYRKRNGERRSFDILNEHLQKVAAMCESLDLRAMMWSDMYFRMASPTGDYYDLKSEFPPDVVAAIPPNVQLVYWDYYRRDEEPYADMIARHRSLGSEPIWAAGAWSWGRFWTDYPTAFATISAGMRATHSEQLSEAFLTIWYDDGSECDPFSILPAVQFFAECAYDPDADVERLERRFPGAGGCDVKPLLLASDVDVRPDGSENIVEANYGKWILWHDPVLGFLNEGIPAGMAEHYEALAGKLAACALTSECAIHERFASTLAHALAGKVRLHLEARQAYRDGDIDTLRTLSGVVLPATVIAVEKLWELHRLIWHTWYKAFGWEVLDCRYAALVARLDTLRRILERHLQDPQGTIPVFDFDPQPVPPPYYFNYSAVYSPGLRGQVAPL